MPGQECGKIAADMPLFRSVSARENQERGSYGVSCEKRRSTSFDETLGELAGVCASGHAGETPEEPIKKKANFWNSRVWRFTKGKKGAMEAQDTKDALSAISEKEENTVPKWKKLLHKLRSRAKDVRKPAVCSSNFDLQVANRHPVREIREEGKSKAQNNQPEKQQRLHSVHPEPVTAASQSTATVPIWERRSVTRPRPRPSTLDLTNLRGTGLKLLPRHQ